MPKRIAALVYFAEHVTLPQAQLAVAQMDRIAVLDTANRAVVREYESDHGDPVWYIP